jgi:hypothetical protein
VPERKALGIGERLLELRRQLVETHDLGIAGYRLDLNSWRMGVKASRFKRETRPAAEVPGITPLVPHRSATFWPCAAVE